MYRHKTINLKDMSRKRKDKGVKHSENKHCSTVFYSWLCDIYQSVNHENLYSNKKFKQPANQSNSCCRHLITHYYQKIYLQPEQPHRWKVEILLLSLTENEIFCNWTIITIYSSAIVSNSCEVKLVRLWVEWRASRGMTCFCSSLLKSMRERKCLSWARFALI